MKKKSNAHITMRFENLMGTTFCTKHQYRSCIPYLNLCGATRELFWLNEIVSYNTHAQTILVSNITHSIEWNTDHHWSFSCKRQSHLCYFLVFEKNETTNLWQLIQSRSTRITQETIVENKVRLRLYNSLPFTMEQSEDKKPSLQTHVPFMHFPWPLHSSGHALSPISCGGWSCPIDWLIDWLFYMCFSIELLHNETKAWYKIWYDLKSLTS